MQKVLNQAAKLCAILAGMLLTLITLSTCINIIGRETIGRTAPGDFELVAVAAGAAIALFMPWCQLTKNNIIVDFFTAKCSERTQAKLDRFGSLLMALLFLVLAWRTALGGINSWSTHTTTMMMGFPEWIVYACMVPPFMLTALIALVQTFSSLAHEGASA
ncbi:MAG: TRAP transporter small permease [Cytophagales bacterium]|nr:TRAP transporter small permease [Cytophagales bacterium]